MSIIVFNVSLFDPIVNFDCLIFYSSFGLLWLSHNKILLFLCKLITNDHKLLERNAKIHRNIYDKCYE